MIVRLKGVKKVRSKGRTYYYHRRSMTRLPGTPSSPEFMRALSLLSKTSTKSTIGSLGHLVSAYRSSPEFAALAPSSRASYNKVFDELKPLDGMPLGLVTNEFLYAWRDKKAKERSRSFANFGIIVFRLLFTWGKRRGKCRVNPALDVELIRKPRNAPVKNRPWRPEELETVLAAALPWLRLAIAIAAYTGLRMSDVIRVTWSCYDGAAFQTRQQKTGAAVWVPAHRRLRELLASAPREHDQIVVGAYGRPIGQSGLSTEFFRLMKRLREDGAVAPGLSFHGLRHTLGTAIIEAGGTRAMAKAVLGHGTEQSSEHYSRTVDQRRLATDAMTLLENRTENRASSH